MKERSDSMMREALADMLGVLEYKVRNGVMSSDDVRTIITTLESGGGIRATVSDLAGFYHRSEADVRNVIHRTISPSRTGASPTILAASVRSCRKAGAEKTSVSSD